MLKKFSMFILDSAFKIALIVIGVFLLFKVATVSYTWAYDFMEKKPSDQIVVRNIDIKIEEGSTTKMIANELLKEELISNVYYFIVMSKLEGFDGKYKYGDYTLNTGMNVNEIMKILLTEGAKQATIQVTIPEGSTNEQIGDIIAESGLCTKTEFLDALNTTKFGYEYIEQIPERNVKMQGYLFPDTYEFYENSAPEDIVSTMLGRFDEVFATEYYDRAKNLGKTVDEIITIASLIEEEVVNPEERKIVSGVIYNRLDIGMNLQMCSSVLYALPNKKDRTLVTYDDLEVDSPYNTYKYNGLPVGPITNPGEASIRAALYPDENDYLYFVLIDPETGSHQFTSSLSDHNTAKAKYKQIY